MFFSQLEKTIEHDGLLTNTVKRTRILSALSWPIEAETKFLEDWRAGNPRYPE